MARLLDQYGGVLSTFHYDHDNDTAIVRTRQDVEPILDGNKFLRNWGTKHQTQDGSMRLAARIPLMVWEQWMKEGMPHGREDQAKFVDKKLRDPDWAYLRTDG